MSHCPSYSNKSLEKLCLPIIKGERSAVTAEELMKARYFAYTVGDIDFIISSNDPETRENISKEATEEWSNSATWLGLDIVNTYLGTEDDEEGVVEFICHFSINGKEVDHHEKSFFRKIDGDWYFVDGLIINQPFVRTTPKVGRNDPCPCGSGKKYKHCCGRN